MIGQTGRQTGNSFGLTLPSDRNSVTVYFVTSVFGCLVYRANQDHSFLMSPVQADSRRQSRQSTGLPSVFICVVYQVNQDHAFLMFLVQVCSRRQHAGLLPYQDHFSIHG